MRDKFIACVSEYMNRGDLCGLCYLLEEADNILANISPPDRQCYKDCIPDNGSGIDVLIALVDVHGVIRGINTVGVQRMGLSSPKEVIGTRLFDYLPPDVRMRSIRALHKAAMTAVPVEDIGFNLNRWFQSLYIPIHRADHENVYLIVRKELQPQREFVEILPNGERVQL